MKALLLLPLLAAAALPADDVPSWVREAAAQPVPAYPPKVAVAVLLNEEHLTVDAAGRRVMRERGVLRAVQQSRGAVRAFRSYNGKSGRIRDFHGWIVAASGKAAELPGNRIADVALSPGDVYSEYRAKVLDPGDDLEAGAVFAYEVVEEERSVFTQYPFAFQDSAPVLVSRFILTVPPGWEVKSETVNAPPLEPSVAGDTYRWEMRGLPWIEPEDYAPGSHVLAPRLGVTYYPPEGALSGIRALKDWNAVSGWLSGLVDPPAAVSDAIRAKAAALTAGASTAMDKIRAIAAFVQETNYVSVQINLTRGGGYTPHSADQTLARNYGDCKDKSTLMRALLAAAGVESFAAVIYWGERYYVRPEWPSPHPFNHMIVAVRIPPEAAAPAVFEHPRLGRLLMFDPTDPFTPVGDIPRDQQGSRALILAGDKGELIAMPLAPPRDNRIESRTEAVYAPDGSLTAKVVRHYSGQPAARLRSLSRSRDKDEFRKSFEAGLSRRLGGMTLARIEPSDRMPEGRLQLELELSVKKFGQLMQQRMLVISPGTLASPPDYGFTTRERKSPVELMGGLRKDAVEIRLPPAFELDELPDPVDLNTEFGRYRARWRFENATLSWDHELEVRDLLVPAAAYPKLREFFESVTEAQTSAAVLLKP